jgi:Spy/CpxP family protein refolding chaperone
MKTTGLYWTFLIAAQLGLASAGAAESTRDLLEQMIPPERVLAQAQALGLDTKQRQSLERIQADLSPRQAPLLRQMHQERDALVALLKQEKPDEAAVVARFEALNAVETELKRLRLRMTIAVKKVLTAPQQAKALSLADRPIAGSGATGTESLPARLQRVKDGLERWKREGRDVTRLRQSWERFREAEDKGFYRQAREALDEAIALLDAPPPRP